MSAPTNEQTPELNGELMDVVMLFGGQNDHKENDTLEQAETAHQTIRRYGETGEIEKAEQIARDALLVHNFVKVTASDERGNKRTSLHVFSAHDLGVMAGRVRSYLGVDWEAYVADPSHRKNRDYGIFADRAMRYFSATDDPTGGFLRHTSAEQQAGAVGPLESTEQKWANGAITKILDNLDRYYNSSMDIKLVRDAKTYTPSGYMSTRGMLQCQFLILDHIRDIHAMQGAGKERSVLSEVSDSVVHAEIGASIIAMLTNRGSLLELARSHSEEAATIMNSRLTNLARQTNEGFYRGKPRIPNYIYRPDISTDILGLISKSVLEILHPETTAKQEELPSIEDLL